MSLAFPLAPALCSAHGRVYDHTGPYGRSHYRARACRLPNGRAGTSNVGLVSGADDGSAGIATNVVTDYVRVLGESRSQDAKFVKEITIAYRTAFIKAASSVTNAVGKTSRVRFTRSTAYHPFRMKESAAVVRRAVAAVSRQGRTPNVRIAKGGLDANWMVRHGIPTVRFGAGPSSLRPRDRRQCLTSSANASLPPVPANFGHDVD
jgi:acetylornithine deacetylase/succinyl-diaminopimelate desuccinylase-like protein